MLHRLLPSLVSVILASSLAAPVLATTDTSTGQPRLLQAQISKHEGMSRSELDDNQISLAPAVNPIPSKLFSGNIQSQAAPLNTNLQNQTAMLNLGAQNQPKILNTQANESDLASDIKLREYNVDWRSWLARVADHWYFVLQQYERANNLQFVTRGPALIKFTCYNNGTIANVSLKQSSGNMAYDRLQVLALMQSMPVPPFPARTKHQTITLVQGWESHVKQAGESEYIPGSFGSGFPMEKVKEWVMNHY